jgi:hypothetical protein
MPMVSTLTRAPWAFRGLRRPEEVVTQAGQGDAALGELGDRTAGRGPECERHGAGAPLEHGTEQGVGGLDRRE